MSPLARDAQLDGELCGATLSSELEVIEGVDVVLTGGPERIGAWCGMGVVVTEDGADSAGQDSHRLYGLRDEP